MGQYKVPQNVEAEDKIIGPLTLKQFIYAIIGVGWGFFTFSIFNKVPVLFVLLGLPPTILFLLLGLYQPQDQPFEARFLAMLNFFGKTRKRLWQKEPIAEIFRLETPPPKPEAPTKNLADMRGQLEKLVRVVDTRGWQNKQAALQEPLESISYEGRLAVPESEPFVTAPQDISLADDILDFKNNPNAQTLNELIEDSVRHIRTEALEKMSQPAAPAPTTGQASVTKMTSPTAPDILRLAREGDALKVSQIAAVAQRQTLAEGQAVSLRDGTTTTQ